MTNQIPRTSQIVPTRNTFNVSSVTEAVILSYLATSPQRSAGSALKDFETRVRNFQCDQNGPDSQTIANETHKPDIDYHFTYRELGYLFCSLSIGSDSSNAFNISHGTQDVIGQAWFSTRPPNARMLPLIDRLNRNEVLLFSEVFKVILPGGVPLPPLRIREFDLHAHSLSIFFETLHKDKHIDEVLDRLQTEVSRLEA